MATEPVDRAEEFIQLFNRVENFLSDLVRPAKVLPFLQLVDVSSVFSAAVHANNIELKQFARLRNAIVHDADYPPRIIAVPFQEALLKFRRIAQEVLEPSPLIPMFATQVRCFSPSDTLPGVLKFMRDHDFSQIVVRDGDGRISMLTAEELQSGLLTI